MSRAGWLLAAAAACVAAGGWLIAATWHMSYGRGLYCAVGTATTVGCDAEPSSAAGRAAAVAVMLTAIPVLAACFALLAGAHVHSRVRATLSEHLGAAEQKLTQEADRRHVLMQRHVERLIAGQSAELKEHVSAAVADGPARGGAGSNPAESGFGAEPEDRPVVPPPSTARTGGV